MISQNSSQITGRCLSGLTAHFLGIEGTLKERNKHKRLHAIFLAPNLWISIKSPCPNSHTNKSD
jgi:hypothetical protein